MIANSSRSILLNRNSQRHSDCFFVSQAYMSANNAEVSCSLLGGRLLANNKDLSDVSNLVIAAGNLWTGKIET